MKLKDAGLEGIPSSIRALYRIIGKIIGKQIHDRVASDDYLDLNPDRRKLLADEVINSITEFRAELIKDRDFDKIKKIFLQLFDKEENIAIKQLAWILEAYLLLNQSSSASAELIKPTAMIPDRLFMSNLIDSIRTKVLQEKDLAKIFTKDFSMNLVLTAHPTAGIQPDYINHIQNMINTVRKVAYRMDSSLWEQNSNNALNESNLADIIEDITLSISHMVRAKPYNLDALKPNNESKNFLDNINEAWEIIPSKIQALEYELKKYLGQDFRLHGRFFRIHSWVARDIDGNPTVTSIEHVHSLLQERVHFLSLYKRDLEKLFKTLSDDFTDDPNYPRKTYFINQEFEALYKSLLEENFHSDLCKPYQAYRMLLLKMINKIGTVIDYLVNIQEISQMDLGKEFNLEKDLIHPLELIRANKLGVNTQEIDKIIRKANIFGEFGSHGHTRQGAEIFDKLVYCLTAFWDNQAKAKTTWALTFEPKDKLDCKILQSKILFHKYPSKIQEKLLQTLDLLELSRFGGIRRVVISMATKFEDMLNVLILSKILGAFRPGFRGSLPWSRLEIVPLTEQIIDLKNSYLVTIEALVNPAWHQYLIANNGRFYKMRGPSDSGKQNGFVASQWYMFRSKQFDTIVVEIFNAFLEDKILGLSEGKQLWLNHVQDDSEESLVIQKSIEAFSVFFASDQFDLNLWQLAYKEISLRRIRLINFDGWGEPIERGGGLEFEDTVNYTQPIASLPYYERTLQGGGAQQLASELRTKQAVQDFINGVSKIAVRRFALDRNYEINSMKLNPIFVTSMEKMILHLRRSLRQELMGIDLEDDQKIHSEENLRSYFRHVIKSPLIFLDLFNIASRPTSRSGSQIKELLDDPKLNYDLDLFLDQISTETILQILSDIRAIPYAAMFSLLGGSHVSFCGFDQVIADKNKYKGKILTDWISVFYHANDDSQEHRLMKHLIDSLERGIFVSDQDCYRKNYEIIEQASNPSYKSGNDLFILKLLSLQQSTINFVALIKKYKNKNPQKVLLQELMLGDKDLMMARRNDAAIPRMGIAIGMSKILSHAKKAKFNPLDPTKIPPNYLDALRKAFAAGASTFGNGCID